MKALALSLLLLAACAAPAHAAKVQLMVVGKERVLRAPAPVKLKTAKVRVSGRTCRIAAATPLAALARTPLEPRLKLEDFGACSSRPADASGLYVRGIGNEVERGADGWVYKVGRRAPSTGGGDPSARLEGGAEVLWFWCRNAAEGCQRTLGVRPSATTAAPGQALEVTVTGYDDDGDGRVVPDATVRVGGVTARTSKAGVASITVPADATGTLRVFATAPGLVRSFPVGVRIG
jgi:hypothetical protein